jgi:putative ABC transport system substrate-binding protein
MIDRRVFIATCGVAAVAGSRRAMAQQSPLRRIGYLSGLSEADPGEQARIAAFHLGLGEHGWRVGESVAITYRFSDGQLDRSRADAAELLQQAPEVFLAIATVAVRALQEATRTIPIVFAAVSDPVGDGFVASIPAPGGNITGFMNFAPEVGGKWVQLLKEIAPRVARIGVLFNPETAPGRGAYFSSNIETMTRSQAVHWAPVPVGAPGDIDSAIAGIAREPGGGLIVLPDSFTSVHRLAIVAAANYHKLPAIYPYRNFVTAGGLVAYGLDRTDPVRRAAAYVDRILKGEKPAELPVQAPVKFEMAINARTANVLGLTIPPTLIVSADEVIE